MPRSLTARLTFDTTMVSPLGAFALADPAGKAADTPAVRFIRHGLGEGGLEAGFSLAHFSMPPGPDEPITALLDLSRRCEKQTDRSARPIWRAAG